MAILLLFIFFISGSVGVGYQVILNKTLTLMLGSSIWSITIIVFSYMIGLTIGSFSFGKFADRTKNPLLLYGIIELFIGLYMLLFPLIFKIFSKILGLYPSAPILFKFFIAFGSVIFPIFLMGGTFPLFTSSLIKTEKDIGNKVSFSYAFNTIGAGTGALIFGFLLLPTFGIRNSFLIGGIINILIFFIIFFLSKNLIHSESGITLQKNKYREELSIKKIRKILNFLFFFNGFIFLFLEIIWYRTLSPIFGNTTYSFSTMLFVYLLGIGVGSILYPLIEIRIKNINTLVKILFFSYLICGVYLIFNKNFLPNSAFLFLRILKIFNVSFITVTFTKLIISFIFIFIPTFISGFIFPLLNKLGVILRKKGEKIGKFYAFNTLGSSIGVLISPLLIPIMGLQNLFIFSSLLLFTISLIIIFYGNLKYKLSALFIPILVILLLSREKYNPILYNSGIYYSVQGYRKISSKILEIIEIQLSGRLLRDSILYYKESPFSNILVTEAPDGVRSLTIDGKTEISEHLIDVRLGKMLSHIPLIYHKKPEEVAIIGLGAGFTSSVFTLYPEIKRIDIIEIDKYVIPAVNYFIKYNYDFLKDKRVNIIEDDGFIYFRYTDKKYDIITSDPFEPVVKETGKLYSLEHFKNLKQHLKKGGFVTQFLPLYQLSPPEIKSVIRTFKQVFRYTEIYFTGSDFILVGYNEEANLKEERIKEIAENEKILKDLKTLGFNSIYDIGTIYVGKVKNIDGRINTVDNNYLEFSIPKNYPFTPIHENMRLILTLFLDENNPFLKICEDNFLKFLIHRKRKLFIDALYLYNFDPFDIRTYLTLKRIYMIEPDNFVTEILSSVALNIGTKIWINRKDEKKAMRFLKESIVLNKENYRAYINIAEIYADIDSLNKAEEYAKMSLKINRKNPRAYLLLYSIYKYKGDELKANKFLKKAKKYAPFIK